jgi:hypothetical protein
MSDVIGKLQVEIVGKIDNLQKSFDNAQSRVSKFGTTFKNTIGALGLVAGAKAIGGFVNNALKAVDATKEFADSIGASFSGLRNMQYAAKFSGVEMETLEKLITKTQLTLSKGTGDDALKNLGLDPAQLSAMSSDESFNTIVQNLSKIENQSERNKQAFEIFGKSAVDVLKIAGDSSYVDNLKDASEINLTSDEDAKRIADMYDAWDKINILIARSIENIATQLLPALEQMNGLMENTASFKFEHLKNPLNFMGINFSENVSDHNDGDVKSKAQRDYQRKQTELGLQLSRKEISKEDYDKQIKELRNTATVNIEKENKDKEAEIENKKQLSFLDKFAEKFEKENEGNDALNELEKNKQTIVDTYGEDAYNKAYSDAFEKTDAGKAQKELEKEKEDALKYSESFMTDDEKKMQEQAKAKEMLDSGLINEDTYNRAMEKNKIEEKKNKDTETGNPIEDAFNQLNEMGDEKSKSRVGGMAGTGSMSDMLTSQMGYEDALKKNQLEEQKKSTQILQNMFMQLVQLNQKNQQTVLA